MSSSSPKRSDEMFSNGNPMRSRDGKSLSPPRPPGRESISSLSDVNTVTSENNDNSTNANAAKSNKRSSSNSKSRSQNSTRSATPKKPTKPAKPTKPLNGSASPPPPPPPPRSAARDKEANDGEKSSSSSSSSRVRSSPQRPKKERNTTKSTAKNTTKEEEGNASDEGVALMPQARRTHRNVTAAGSVGGSVGGMSRREGKENGFSGVSTDIDSSASSMEEGKAPPPAATSFSTSFSTSVSTSGGAAAAGSGRGEKGKADPKKETDTTESREFVGRNLIQYGLWGHYMAYGSASLCLCMGIFAAAYTRASAYGCEINGSPINSIYLFTANGTCPSTFVGENGQLKIICCNPDADTKIEGNLGYGFIFVLYSIFLVLVENTEWGYGLWFPADSVLYRNRISIVGILDIILGIIGLTNYVTFLAGAALISNGIVYCYARYRYEAGDGGRGKRAKARETARARAQKDRENRNSGRPNDRDNEEKSSSSVAECRKILSFNPVAFYYRIYNEDKLSSYVWVAIFCLANLLVFAVTLDTWVDTVNLMKDEMKDGTLNIYCGDNICKTNRKAIKFGPFSDFAPLAKACGACLNLNCALILLPVIRMLLRKLNNLGTSFNAAQQNNDLLAKFCARPLSRYIPLQKNIEFHKLCAGSVFLFAWGHMVFHMLNLMFAANTTLQFFRFARWDGTDYLTGALISFAMFMIYTAAPDIVRMSKYEIFFNAHHFFTVFFFVLFLHGPIFFAWGAIPVVLYILERYMQTRRGNRPYQLLKVEWIPPVMAVYFRPIFKEDFVFKEGQYLYLNCPHISPTEWHPFTISSASDDLHFGPRIHLESGEEVQEIPRPNHLPSRAKWNKYCLLSQDWRTLDPATEYLEKGETGYMDFVSVHIKVHGLDEAYARTWTRKLKEYFELMSPTSAFPFYFSQRDKRGEIAIGRQYGPDGLQILRVDGPHSAPSEHYTNYGTVMVVGAGIGLTPCASVLCALTKYRWRKNFNPELLHFYWIVRQNEIESFQWLVHMLTELSFELKRGKSNGQIDKRYYCEINIYVTGASDKYTSSCPLYRPKKTFDRDNIHPTFSADELYEKMLHPTVPSKGQVAKMREKDAENRLQDIWIWNGRPNWDEVFRNMKEQRQHSDIGVCFCGAPVIGADLRNMCEKYSDASEDCLFSLHKENF